MKLWRSFVSQNYSILLACLVDDLAAEFYNYLNFLFFFLILPGSVSLISLVFLVSAAGFLRTADRLCLTTVI